MAQITAALVKDLREKTGVGMMDCKKALGETDGDLEAAVDWLRTKGLASAAKKAGRIASEGLVGMAVDGTKGAMVEVNSETDFVARNETFQNFVSTCAKMALTTGADMDALKASNFPGSDRTVEDELTNMISTIGENMNLRRVEAVSVNSGAVISYMHNAIGDGIGKIGVLVGLESDADGAALEGTGKQLAMHVAAANPQSISRDDLDPDLVQRERDVLSQQARDSGKPENIIEKMVEGRMRKFYEESCLVDQTFVIDGESTVGKVIEQAGSDAGGSISVAKFVRYSLGEGLEKKDEDFAAEVAAVSGG
ncbi:MAG: elongation factor Ts [Rhodospirillales bacterium]|nr:elongation factor Ts [Rhodospirillales bacterium]